MYTQIWNGTYFYVLKKKCAVYLKFIFNGATLTSISEHELWSQAELDANTAPVGKSHKSVCWPQFSQL